MKTLIRILTFFRLVNGDDNLSLTNIALMVGIVAFYRHPGTVEIGALMTAVAMYHGKKMLSAAADERETSAATEEHSTALASLKDSVEKASAQTDDRIKRLEGIINSANVSRTIAEASRLVQGRPVR